MRLLGRQPAAGPINGLIPGRLRLRGGAQFFATSSPDFLSLSLEGKTKFMGFPYLINGAALRKNGGKLLGVGRAERGVDEIGPMLTGLLLFRDCKLYFFFGAAVYFVRKL